MAMAFCFRVSRFDSIAFSLACARSSSLRAAAAMRLSSSLIWFCAPLSWASRLTIEGWRGPDERAKFRALAGHFGVLRAQLSDGLRQHGLGDRAVLGAALARLRNLVDAGARLGDLAARGVELRRSSR